MQKYQEKLISMISIPKGLETAFKLFFKPVKPGRPCFVVFRHLTTVT